MTLPVSMWGGRPTGFFEAAGLAYKRTSTPGEFLARTDESLYRRKPDLVRLIKAAGPGEAYPGLAQLVQMADETAEAGITERIGAHLEELANPEGILAMMNYYQVATTAVTAADLPEQCGNVYESMREVTLIEDEAPAFRHPGIYAIRRMEPLLHRIKLVSVLLRMQHDETLMTGDLSQLRNSHGSGANVFASSNGLHTGYYMLDPFVGPVLGALTPGIWGVAATRGHGPIIFSLGRPIAGGSAYAPEFLRTLHTPGADRVEEFSDLSPGSVPSALAWWVSRLNELFGTVTDPLVATDSGGSYQPTRHLQIILTVEQLFRRTVSIQANHHDLNARRVVLFSILDTLEALTGRPIDKHCDLDFASSVLERLEASIPAEAKEILLPRGQRAVEALAEVQDGFFMRTGDGNIMIEPSLSRSVTPAKAAAQYLKVLRNATHGHSSRSHKTRRAAEIADTLLACHNGDLPHDVSLLAWLYLLDFMNTTDDFRSRLIRQAVQAPAV